MYNKSKRHKLRALSSVPLGVRVQALTTERVSVVVRDAWLPFKYRQLGSWKGGWNRKSIFWGISINKYLCTGKPPLLPALMQPCFREPGLGTSGFEPCMLWWSEAFVWYADYTSMCCYPEGGRACHWNIALTLVWDATVWVWILAVPLQARRTWTSCLNFLSLSFLI